MTLIGIHVTEKLSRNRDSTTTSKKDFDYLINMQDYFNNGKGTLPEKIESFAKYVPRQSITRFLSRYEIFKKILNIQGSIIECGVFFGQGLMSFAQFSAIFEPVNNQRKIIGFDTFSGFPSVSKFDKASDLGKKGKLSTGAYKDILEGVSLFDSNRFLEHIPKVEVVKGDATKTIPKYIKENPHTVVSLLYLDFDIYEPTKAALKHFVPRMPKGSIIAFDELNSKNWKGESVALLETLGIRNLKIERFSFDSYLSYAILD